MAAYYPLFEEEIKQGPPGVPGIGFKLTNDGNYDMENIQLKNVGPPTEKSDAVHKRYVDKRTKINDKIVNNILKRDDDGLYVLSLMKHGVYDFGNNRLTNVSEPLIPIDVATKNYVDSQDFFATSKGRFDCSPNTFKEVTFEVTSSSLLDHNLKVSEDMFLKLTVEVFPTENIKLQFFQLQVKLNDQTIQQIEIAPLQPMSHFLKVKKNDVFKIFLHAKSSIKLRPLLYVRKIVFI
ncbi:hypothetical protein AVEN_53954-1 [Araneus ventricosus]|uniref:Uncharacterized protein n=1 Tax=Araneus ventricosus TaxID=182803 RepID=A0A4Y2G1A5_ARAVE|nr:hypothetical protein AVEN_53954-1 [Araneus ventricosus]